MMIKHSDNFYYKKKKGKKNYSRENLKKMKAYNSKLHKLEEISNDIFTILYINHLILFYYLYLYNILNNILTASNHRPNSNPSMSI